MTLVTIAGSILALNILLALWGAMILLHPQWSEHYGRRLIAHSQALRDFNALFRRAREAYRSTYRTLNVELEKVTY